MNEHTRRIHDLQAEIARQRARLIEIGQRLGQSELRCEQLRRKVAALTEQLERCGVTVAHEDRVVSD